jgi:hypothetical protein
LDPSNVVVQENSASAGASESRAVKNTDDPTTIGPDESVTVGTTAVALPILV